MRGEAVGVGGWTAESRLPGVVVVLLPVTVVLKAPPCSCGLCVQAERFMLEMLKLPDSEERLRSLMYMRQFHSRLSELRNDVKVIERACDDVKISLELKKLLKVVLTLGNHMNEGQQTAFTLDSLLKLNEAKAFDKKTSILHYLVQVRQDPRQDRNKRMKGQRLKRKMD